MKLYGHPMSSCTRAVLIALGEKNHEAEFVVVELMKGEHKSAAYLSHHPFGVVPVLEDGAFKLFESRAIVRYLDAKLPGVSLTPTKQEDRALMEQWASVEQSYFSPSTVRIVKEMVHKRMRGQEPDMAVVQNARGDVESTTDVLDRALAGQEFLAGGMFSLADIAFMPYLGALVALGQGDIVTSRPNVNAWWNRISARPSWQAVLAKAVR